MKHLPRENDIFHLTETINQRGVLIDREFAEAAVTVAKLAKKELDKEIRHVTSGAVTACTQVHNLRQWCQAKGFFLPDDEQLSDEKVSMDRNAIDTVLATGNPPDDVRRALEIRRAGARSSVAKYEAMLRRVCPDNHVRQHLLYHGASTGRWAGMGIQTQNFPRKTVKDWNHAKAQIMQSARTGLPIKSYYGMDVMTLLSRMLRGTIIAPPGKLLVYPDYSQIEARGVAWLAGAQRLLGLFRNGGPVYEDMAGVIYNIDPASVAKDSRERFTGKQAVLGCGYGMGKDKFASTCEGYGMPMSIDEADAAVTAYRTSNHEIPSLWRAVEATFKRAIRTPGKVFALQMYEGGPVTRFYRRRKDKFLLVMLPSGRPLYYFNPTIEVVATKKFGDKECIFTWTMDSFTRKWTKKPIWGGHLVENIVQGFCRDIVADAMLFMEHKSNWLTPILTVHDEVVAEIDEARFRDNGYKHTRNCMLRGADWMDGLPVECDVSHGVRYGK